ncbi:LytR/AlgR family response regulator transcription factor [Polaribacter dokdonensis]|jgi:two-component system, LytTR family, response regulator|uniref:Putative two-component response regulator autolysis regulator LytR n=1 Tax=Polaribacter dokdonensis DSW-5 TaxID=1300348 RepID=A0A0N0CFX4_9FLAO|nr:LytTR family DNA-binding domain-containing protein [Polaribacter dokdonensis]KOY52447.1 putative two-component response regulator autolysis regulator LytR [Polaribacter dokdonensis DSW-5]SEE45718.1 two component transcriptional regulator, LytTR family [Polaribacter dokdonensis DSW-5]
MKIVIVEDEQLAAEKLERYLLKYNTENKIVVVLTSITDAVSWFNTNIDYDVIFMDIQLTDGLSFEIFNQTKINKPVIFSTAFDEYAVDAFKVNSIDYILKPITFTDISKAMNKLKQMQSIFSSESIAVITNDLQKKKTKDRFLVRLGNHIHSIKTEDIALFYAEGRTVYLITKEQKRFILDFKLEDVHNLLSSQSFFRVNRSFIVNINSIKDVLVFSNSRLKITSKVNVDKEIIVSREKVSAFKTWLEGI